MSGNNHQQDLTTQIGKHHRSGEFDKALEISVTCTRIQSGGLEGLWFPMETDSRDVSRGGSEKKDSP